MGWLDAHGADVARAPGARQGRGWVPMVKDPRAMRAQAASLSSHRAWAFVATDHDSHIVRRFCVGSVALPGKETTVVYRSKSYSPCSAVTPSTRCDVKRHRSDAGWPERICPRSRP